MPGHIVAGYDFVPAGQKRSMPTVQIIHNPGAGNAGLSKKELVSLVENAGYSTSYFSTKKEDWKSFTKEKADLIMMAGGDGTIRKTCKALHRSDYRKNPTPLVLLPQGTANNLSKTLCPERDPEKLLEALPGFKTLNFGIGRLQGVEDEDFFMESFGYGIFPYLMMEMKKKPEMPPEESLQTSLETLHQLILDYPPRQCKLNIDGFDHSGEYIMAEIMNIKSIGPNLFISPEADPSDDVFEIVLVAADRKQDFADYIQRSIDNNKATFEFICFRGKNISMQWEGTHVHVDDRLIKLKKNAAVSIRNEPAVFKFLVPADHFVNGPHC